MATDCARIDSDPDKIKAYIDGLGTPSLVSMVPVGNKSVIVYVIYT